MKFKNIGTIAAATVATIVASIGMGGCQGRKMSNMEPLGETVEVVIDTPDTASTGVDLHPDRDLIDSIR
ncbi:MAG: hypothetical protein K2G67_00760 [Muribaculaceae bacterium]|nr:hypothetical protein [Muribaculaceae bacterium]